MTVKAVITDRPKVATNSRCAKKTPPKWIEADKKMTRLGRSAIVMRPTSSPPALPARAPEVFQQEEQEAAPDREVERCANRDDSREIDAVVEPVDG